MGRRCKVCQSPNQAEYDRLFLDEKWEIKDIWRYAKIKKNEDIPYDSFRYHFKHHVKEIVEATVKASRLRDKKIKEEISKTIDISTKLRENLERIQAMIDTELDKEENVDISLLLELMKEARQLYKLLLDYSEKLDLGPSIDKESLYDQVIESLIEAQIPDSLIFKFSEAWKKRENV